VYGRNVAWYYPDGYFHGNIRLQHGPYWLLMGAGLYKSYPFLRAVLPPPFT
jgi:hypothetical protein